VTICSRVVAFAAALPLALGVAACADLRSAEPKTATKSSAAPVKVAPLPRLTTANFMPTTNKASAKVNSMTGIMRMNQGGAVTSMTISQTFEPATMKLGLSSPALGGPVELLVVKGTVYLSAPKLAPSKYVRVDLKSSKDPRLTALAGLIDSASSTTESYDRAVRNVRLVKAETVGLRKVDRYDVTMDTAIALKIPRKKLPAGVPKTMVYSLWLGADRLPYKMYLHVGAMDALTTVTSYGGITPFTAPPANKIVQQR
jgi:hypothetical protein